MGRQSNTIRPQNTSGFFANLARWSGHIAASIVEDNITARGGRVRQPKAGEELYCIHANKGRNFTSKFRAPDYPFNAKALATNEGMARFIDNMEHHVTVYLLDTEENMRVMKRKMARELPSKRIKSKIAHDAKTSDVVIAKEAWLLMTSEQRDLYLRYASYINLR
jgi:hypothetical protein